MSYFGRNIRKIRNAKNISQTQFAQLFSLTRASIGAYEEGRAEAKIDTIIAIARHFEISVDMLLLQELTLNEIFHLSKRTKSLSESLNPLQPTQNTDNKSINTEESASSIEHRLSNIEKKMTAIEELLNQIANK